MKPLTLLLFTTSLLVAASGAFAQEDACSKQYGACMDRCASRPQSVQGSCSQTCEGGTDQCYVGLYGHRPPEGQASAPAAAPEARNAQGSAATTPNGQ
jgi:hypothetical protein